MKRRAVVNACQHGPSASGLAAGRLVCVVSPAMVRNVME